MDWGKIIGDALLLSILYFFLLFIFSAIVGRLLRKIFKPKINFFDTKIFWIFFLIILSTLSLLTSIYTQ